MGHLFDEDTVRRLARLFAEFTDTDSLGDRILVTRAFSTTCQELLAAYPDDAAQNPALFAEQLEGWVDRLPVINTVIDVSTVDRLPELEALKQARLACLPFYPELALGKSELGSFDDAFNDYAMACYSVGVRHGAVCEHIRAALGVDR